MNFNIRLYNNSSVDEIIKFLNTKARSFYQSKHTFQSSNYECHFKANIQVAMVDIERTIRGTFGCDIFMKYADRNLLKEMFPNGYTNIFKVKSEEDLKLMGRALEALRNMNSHAKLTERDYEFFDTDYSHLEKQPKMNNRLIYFDGEITIAGLIFIVCNFLREQSLATLVKSDFLFSLVVSGNYSLDKGERFVREISHVNLEKPIRQSLGTSLKDSVFGDYKRYVAEDGNSFELIIGSLKYPTTKISGSITDDEIIIESGSLSRVYYKNTYKLKVSALNSFIELANQLPSFALVDYLYASNISVFDKTQYETIKRNFNMVSKLNYPKFYTNKSVNVILLPETISDFTLLSALFSDSLLKFLLILEGIIYKEKQIPSSQSGLSSIGYALHGIDAPQELIREVKFLRNFVAHGYLLDESLIYDGCAKEYSVDFVLTTLYDLMSFLKNEDEQLFVFAKKVLVPMFIEKLCNAKYKKAIGLSHDIVDTYPKYDKKELYIKNNFINHSYLDITVLNSLNNLIEGGVKILEVFIKGLKDHLYFKNTDSDCELINRLCERCNLDIESEQDKGITYHYYLS